MSRPSLGSKRSLRVPFAGAILGSLLLSALPAFAEAPPPEPAPVAPVPSTTPEAPPPAPVEPAAEAAPAPPPPVEAPPQPPVAPPAEVAPLPPPPPVEAAPPPPEKNKLPSYLMWGVGGASLVVGAVFGVAALTAESDFKDNPTYDKADTVHTRALVSDVGLGLGAILLVSGTVFYFVDDNASTQQAKSKTSPLLARLAVAPVIGLKTQGAAVTLKF
jgi:hypothetical protein